MVFTDARSRDRDSVVTADICIIGAGVAGISLANEYIGRSARVVVIEGGGLEFTKSLRNLPTVLRRHTMGEQGLAAGRNSGLAYYPLRFTRARAFGGSSRAWHDHRGVHAHPLDDIDFESREGLPEHGWPFGRDDLDLFYERAQHICALGPYAYDTATWSARGHGSPLPLDDGLVESVIFQFGRKSKFDRFEADFASADNVEVILHATAVRLADGSGMVKSVECATLSGTRFRVEAETFVLAAGAIESARLLLASTDSEPTGIGNANDLVGRYFMEHPDLPVGYLIPDPDLDPDAFDLYQYRDAGDDLAVEAMFRLSDSALKSGRLLNSVLRLRPTFRTGMPASVQSARAVRRSIHHGVPTRGLAGHAVRAALGAPQIVRHYASKRSGDNPDIFGIDVMAEQEPTRASRVRLSSRTDRMGVPRTILDWQLTDLDWESIRRTVEIFGEAVSRAGIGEVVSTVDTVTSPVYGNWHHLGTTRMHNDPAHGVVDENCRVHGIDNLYVAGGSIFPTGGYANPTLTIVALALRLADHLESA